MQAFGSLKDNILFLHVLTGCYTTSAPCLLGKRKGTKYWNPVATWSMWQSSTSQRQVQRKFQGLVRNFLLALYGDSSFNSLNDFKLTTLKKKKSTKQFQVTSLPPSAAALQHSFRTYCQAQQWMGDSIDPTKWEWVPSNGSFLLVPVYLPLAPDKLMHIESCNCKVGCTCGCGCQQGSMLCSTIVKCMKLTCNTAFEQWLRKLGINFLSHSCLE